MRIANLLDRPHLVSEDGTRVAAVATVVGPESDTFFRLYSRWDDFVARVRSAELDSAAWVPLDRSQLGSPSPAPRQILAAGLNYREHAAESGFTVPDVLPPVFTKFMTSLSGPDTQVALPQNGNTDWEAELVVVIGRGGRDITEADAWSHVAGLAVGQDLSERVAQMQGPVPQFSMGKSLAGFAPVGPWLVTLDELDNPDDIALGCSIDGEVVQDGRTRDLVFPVPALIRGLSAVVELLPGDLIFTGTPAGVGVGRNPQRFLQAGEELTTWAEGIGELHQRFISPAVTAL